MVPCCCWCCAALIAIGARWRCRRRADAYLDIFGDKWDQFIEWLQGNSVIRFRYHIVSIIAVFLALALGIVVGTTGLERRDPARPAPAT